MLKSFFIIFKLLLTSSWESVCYSNNIFYFYIDLFNVNQIQLLNYIM